MKFIPYFGNKRKEIHHIIPYLPDNIATVVDVFGGSGCVGISIKEHYPESQLVYNDNNNKVIKLIKLLKSYKNILSKDDMEFNDDQDMKRGLENVKKIWTTQKQGIVLNILKYFVNDCGIEGEIHMTALREDCGVIQIEDFLHWFISRHTRYKILIKLPNNSYKLNPQVIQHLNLKNN